MTALAPVVELDAESMTYPRHLLEDCGSALLLFCSGRMGAADGHWVREAGLTDVTCVDWDEKTLEPFRAAYPDGWFYCQSDAFEWASYQERRWDLVSADVPSQWADRLCDTLPLWCELAERYVTVTVMAHIGDPIPAPPEGWTKLDFIHRTVWEGRSYNWLVLERAPA